jgi:hypothetical protein
VRRAGRAAAGPAGGGGWGRRRRRGAALACARTRLLATSCPPSTASIWVILGCTDWLHACRKGRCWLAGDAGACGAAGAACILLGSKPPLGWWIGLSPTAGPDAICASKGGRCRRVTMRSKWDGRGRVRRCANPRASTLLFVFNWTTTSVRARPWTHSGGGVRATLEHQRPPASATHACCALPRARKPRKLGAVAVLQTRACNSSL